MDLMQILLTVASKAGTWLIYVMVGMCVPCTLVTFERSIVLTRTRSDFDTLFKMIITRLFQGDKITAVKEDIAGMKGLDAGVIRQALDRMDMGPAAVEEVLIGLTGLEQIRLERGTALLGVAGFMSPLLGLVGTVLGIIRAFNGLAEDPLGGARVLVLGLSEALAPLVIGLVISIPCLLAYYVFRRRVRQRIAELNSLSHLVLAGMKSKR